MRQVLIDQDIPLAEDERLIKRLWKVDKTDNFPTGLEFAYQFLYFKNNEWLQIARIDNQLHEGNAGVHIHIRHKVIWEELSFEEAEKRIIELAHAVIKGGYYED